MLFPFRGSKLRLHPWRGLTAHILRHGVHLNGVASLPLLITHLLGELWLIVGLVLREELLVLAIYHWWAAALLKVRHKQIIIHHELPLYLTSRSAHRLPQAPYKRYVNKLLTGILLADDRGPFNADCLIIPLLPRFVDYSICLAQDLPQCEVIAGQVALQIHELAPLENYIDN